MHILNTNLHTFYYTLLYLIVRIRIYTHSHIFTHTHTCSHTFTYPQALRPRCRSLCGQHCSLKVLQGQCKRHKRFLSHRIVTLSPWCSSGSRASLQSTGWVRTSSERPFRRCRCWSVLAWRIYSSCRCSPVLRSLRRLWTTLSRNSSRCVPLSRKDVSLTSSTCTSSAELSHRAARTPSEATWGRFSISSSQTSPNGINVNYIDNYIVEFFCFDFSFHRSPSFFFLFLFFFFWIYFRHIFQIDNNMSLTSVI